MWLHAMIRSIRLLPAALVALAACTPMHYERPGAAPGQIALDERQCSDLAARQAFLYSPYPFGPSSYMMRNPSAYLAWRNQVELDELQAGRDLTDFCMRARGYQLVPDTGTTITWTTP